MSIREMSACIRGMGTAFHRTHVYYWIDDDQGRRAGPGRAVEGARSRAATAFRVGSAL